MLARIIVPTSKADTIRALGEIGMPARGLRTIFRSLDRSVARDYRDLLAKSCVARCAGDGPSVMATGVPHDGDAIETHLTVVFAALAVGRDLQARTGVSLKKLVQTLRPLRTVTSDIDGHTITAKSHLTDAAEHVLANLPPVTG